MIVSNITCTYKVFISDYERSFNGGSKYERFSANNCESSKYFKKTTIFFQFSPKKKKKKLERNLFREI